MHAWDCLLEGRDVVAQQLEEERLNTVLARGDVSHGLNLVSRLHIVLSDMTVWLDVYEEMSEEMSEEA